MSSVSCRIYEIFLSLQGESTTQGYPTVFVRLSGCPLRCVWCDTAYAFSGGRRMEVVEILTTVASHRVSRVTVTGGEPLAQKSCGKLLSSLCDAGYEVSLETSGGMDIAAVDQRVQVVMDLKAPGSGEVAGNRMSNIHWLSESDQIKFVIADRADYEWSCKQLSDYQLVDRCGLLYSPVWGELAPEQLAAWILEDRLPVRMQLQLHKLLWGDVPGT